MSLFLSILLLGFAQSADEAVVPAAESQTQVQRQPDSYFAQSSVAGR